MPIEVTLHEDGETLLVRAYDNVTDDDVYVARKEIGQLSGEHTITQRLVDASRVTSLLGGNTARIFSVGASYSESGTPKSMRSAYVLPEDPTARSDTKFLNTVQANRGRRNARLFDDLESAWAWLRCEEE